MKNERSFNVSDEICINGVESSKMADALRILAAEAVENAKSGHPGMPMGMAEIAVALWSSKLKHNPLDPNWINRDRFVLSNGHGSMLIYSLLYLTGYDLDIEDIKKFRKLGSKTPGHPEVDVTPGIETTTGPLGQGIANGVEWPFLKNYWHLNLTGLVFRLLIISLMFSSEMVVLWRG